MTSADAVALCCRSTQTTAPPLLRLVNDMHRGMAVLSLQRRVVKAAHATQLHSLVSTAEDVYPFASMRHDETQTFACAFSRQTNRKLLLAVADEDGQISLLDPLAGALRERERGRHQWLGHQNAIFDVAWATDDTKLATASGDQTVRVWDTETNDLLAVFEGHKSTVKTVAWQRQDPHVLASASRDGAVMVWDLRSSGTQVVGQSYSQHRPVRIIHNAHVPSNASLKKLSRNHHIEGSGVDTLRSVTSALFVRDDVIASSGATDGCIKLWDLRDVRVHSHNKQPLPMATFRTENSAGSHERPHGISSLAYHSDTATLIASCVNDSLSMYSCTTPYIANPIRTFSAPGFNSKSFFVRASISPDGQTVACGSKDSRIYLWQVDDAKRATLALSGHEREINCVTWGTLRNSPILASCSDDATVRVWRTNADMAQDYKQNQYLFWGGAADVMVPAIPATPRRSPRRRQALDELVTGPDNTPPGTLTTTTSLLKRPLSPLDDDHLGFPLSPPASSPLKRACLEDYDEPFAIGPTPRLEPWPSRGIFSFSANHCGNIHY